MTAVSLPRPLDRSEAFFWFLDHFSSMNFAVIAECDVRFSGDALQAALATAGQRHPLLNAGIDTVDGRLHFVPHAATGIPLEASASSAPSRSARHRWCGRWRSTTRPAAACWR
jgi:hypothetical protein